MSEKITVQKANVVFDVAAEDKSYYMSKGFSVIDPNSGIVLEEAMLQDVGALQKQVAELKKEIEGYKEALKLKDETIAELMKETEEKPEVKPTKSRSRSK